MTTVDLQRIVDESIVAIQGMSLESVLAASFLMIRTLQTGGTIYACGNGGSAAHAGHLTAELVGRFHTANRRALAAICLNADMIVMTAIANDFGYEHVFSRQLAGAARSGDLLVVFSTSGFSENVVRAMHFAKHECHMNVILVTREWEAVHPDNVDVHVTSGPGSIARIQEAHQVAIHMMCAMIDEAFA